MSSFTTKLRLEYLDGREWRVLEDFLYEVGTEGSGIVVTVGAGFETDFASIPRGLWNLFPPTGPYGKAAVVHDCLYRTQTLMSAQISRKRADDIFLEAMGVLHVGRFTKYTVYWAVRAGGGRIWRTHADALTASLPEDGDDAA